MPISHSNSDLAPEKLSRKESSELEYYGSSGGGSGLRGDPGGGTNSNGTLNTLTDGGNTNNNNNNNHNGGGHADQPADTVEFSEACLTSMKAFFRNKGICGK